jgi:hypothetical protein
MSARFTQYPPVVLPQIVVVRNARTGKVVVETASRPINAAPDSVLLTVVTHSGSSTTMVLDPAGQAELHRQLGALMRQ